MTVTLPYRNETRPLFRVLTADTWGGGIASGGTWTVEPSFDKFTTAKPYAFGFEVLFASRVCLPAVGEARIRFRYGLIDGRIVAPSDATFQRERAGTAWNPSTDTLTIPDLRRKEIRIQAAPRVGDNETPAWRTVWWGQCEFMEDRDAAGAPIPMGERIYHCVDGFYRTKRWPLNRHGFYLLEPDGTNTRKGERAIGHPGYNSVDSLGITRGNKETSGDSFDPTKNDLGKGGDGRYNVGYHVWDGAGAIWTDRQAIEHAINVSRPLDQPVFLLSGTTQLYTNGEGSPYEVFDEDSAWDFASRACRRQRGRGVAFVDWEDDSGQPTGALTISIRVRPQLLGDVTYTVPGTSTHTVIPGATTAATTVEVDLIGDHRNAEKTFSLGDRDQHRVDYLESLGEKIQVLVTLSRYDGEDEKISLDNRWLKADEDTFSAITRFKRVDERWRPVFQLYGIPRTWGAKAGDHNRGKIIPYHRVDYRCLDDGTIAFPGGAGPVPPNNTWDTDPILIEVLPDLPLLEGYDYKTKTIARKDAQDEKGTPQRRPPMILLRLAENRYILGEEARQPMTINVGHDGIFMYCPGDVDRTGAYRTVGDRSKALGSAYNNNQIGCTVGLALPHRVRLATAGTDADGKTLTGASIRRRLSLRHDSLHLWLASPGAIWDLDSNSTTVTRVFGQGSAGLRNAAAGSTDSPGILRDDRGILAKRHALSCEWFLRERRTATWGLRACGLLPSFEYADGNGAVGGTTPYPTLGYVVTALSAAGQDSVINTPITSITYDNEEGLTTWTTDWGELDFQ